MRKINLKNGDYYRSKGTGKIYELILDYDGKSWYLYCRDNDGVSKTLSCGEIQMLNTLHEYYDKL